MIELAGRIFHVDAIDAIVEHSARPGSSYVVLRGGASFTLDMPYEDVRSRLIAFGALLTEPPVMS